MSLEVDICKDFGNFRLELAFRHDEGVLGLLGGSGCGKSLTMKCIAGLIRPDRGRIVLDGRVLFDSDRWISLKPQDRQLGYLFQNYVLFPNMTVVGNIESAMSKLPKSERKDLLDSLLESFYLMDLADRKPDQLSGGQQQRVALARMLAARPKLIMLDEPFSSLDGYLKYRLEEEMVRLFDRYDGRVIYVSHSREEIDLFCDRVCVMEAGQIVEMTTKRNLFLHPQRLSTAKLAGCKNFSRLVRDSEDPGRIFALDWDADFSLDGPVPKGATHIGVWSQDLKLVREEGVNSFPVEFIRILEDRETGILVCRPKGNQGRSMENRLRINLPANSRSEGGVSGELYCQIDTDKLLFLQE